MVEQFVDTQRAGGVQKRFTDPKACQQWGGHCWMEKDESLFFAYPAPPMAPVRTRTCKHCGLKQRGVYQEPVRWEVVPE